MKRSDKVNVVLVLSLALISLIIYSRVFDFPFLGGDDKINIFRNALIVKPSLEKVSQFWQHPFLQLYIPVTYTIWSFLSWVSPATSPLGISAMPFHVMNILLHFINGILVFLIIQQLFALRSEFKKEQSKNQFAAFIGSCLFLVHPMQVESVAWVTGMKDVLCVFFSLFSILMYMKYLKCIDKKSSATSYVLALVFYILAVLSKPSGIVVFPILVFISLFWMKRDIKTDLKKWIPWVLVATLVVIVTKVAQPGSGLITTSPLWLRPLIGLDSLWFYLAKIVFPLQLCFDYARTPEAILKDGWVYVSWGPSILILILLWKQKLKRPWIFFSGGLFILAVSPMLGFVPFKYQDVSTVADRYMYLPLLGVAFATACLVKLSKGKLSVYGIALVLSLFLFKSWSQVDAWRSDDHLDRAIASVQPQAPRAYRYRAEQQLKQGHLEAALSLFHQHYEASKGPFRYAQFLKQQHRYADAIRVYQETLERYPNHPNTPSVYFGMGEAYFEQEKYSKALIYYQIADASRSNFLDAVVGIVKTYEKLGNTQEVENFKRRVNQIFKEQHYSDLPRL